MNKFSYVVGGVETHIEMLVDWQRKNGIEVDRFGLEDVPGVGFDVNSSGLGAKARSIQTLLWSRSARDALSRKLSVSRPDVVHFHNFSHHLSPSVLMSGHGTGIANVVTAHDYKMVAPCYLLFRAGGFCDDCAGKRVPLPAVQHQCIKDSTSKSAVCVVEHVAHRRVYRNEVDAYIAPSKVASDLLKRSDSVVSGRVETVPHGVPVRTAPSPGADGFRVLYMGRLAPEKGVARLIQAWKDAGLPDRWKLQIAGEGSEKETLEEMARGLQVSFLGQLSTTELEEVLDGASVVVVPSIFPETFCLSAAEAMALGVPVIVSDAGNLPDLVGEPELVVEGDGPEGWTRMFEWLDGNHVRLASLGRSCRERIVQHYSMDQCGESTTAVYERAIMRRLSLAS